MENYKMNISLLKVITIMSCFIGVICGLVALLPYLNGLAFFVLICLSSIIIVLTLMKMNVLKLESIPESLTMGGIIGFISYIAFSIVYIPLAILLIRVFKYSANYGVSLMLGHSNLFVILIISVFLAAFCATVNGITSLCIYYVCKFIENLNNPQQ